MADLKVRYIGSKKGKTVTLPVPFVSLSEKEGEVTFAGPGDVKMMPEKDARALVEVAPSLFALVPEPDKKADK